MFLKRRRFLGLFFDFRLIGLQLRGEVIYVSLTELGKEFALLENPILDKYLYESAFSDREVYFILHKIYDRFKLEKKIIHTIIELLKKEPLTASRIDELFKNENRKSYTVE